MAEQPRELRRVSLVVESDPNDSLSIISGPSSPRSPETSLSSGATSRTGSYPMKGSLVYFVKKDANQRADSAQQDDPDQCEEVQFITQKLDRFEIRPVLRRRSYGILETPSSRLIDEDPLQETAIVRTTSDNAILEHQLVDDPFADIDKKVNTARRSSLAWFDKSMRNQSMRNQSFRNHSYEHGRRYSDHTDESRSDSGSSDTIVSSHSHRSHRKHHHHRHHHHHRRSDVSVSDLERSPRRINSDDDTTEVQSHTQVLPKARRRDHRRRLTCAMIFTEPKVIGI